MTDAPFIDIVDECAARRLGTLLTALELQRNGVPARILKAPAVLYWEEGGHIEREDIEDHEVVLAEFQKAVYCVDVDLRDYIPALEDSYVGMHPVDGETQLFFVEGSRYGVKYRPKYGE